MKLVQSVANSYSHTILMAIFLELNLASFPLILVEEFFTTCHDKAQIRINRGLNAVLMRRQSCVEAYAEDAQAPASSFGSEKEGSLSKA